MPKPETVPENVTQTLSAARIVDSNSNYNKKLKQIPFCARKSHTMDII